MPSHPSLSTTQVAGIRLRDSRTRGYRPRYGSCRLTNSFSNERNSHGLTEQMILTEVDGARRVLKLTH